MTKERLDERINDRGRCAPKGDILCLKELPADNVPAQLPNSASRAKRTEKALLTSEGTLHSLKKIYIYASHQNICPFVYPKLDMLDKLKQHTSWQDANAACAVETF
ncbi:hypothetical protein M514_03991 [Trichuris suis]|uniref:Uncharacterized protein n=1 Tax=Trichuris suis TaxID=68888 RepID=A0A085MCX7_9BILA|nr:hypothetical protein M513_03991 [Trichuris suis]KFD72569.1 hypothetical protein M514_03991 [Trichuris suis]